MKASDFHKGDLIETSWGERAIVYAEPDEQDFNVVLRFHKRKMPASTTDVLGPDRLNLVRRARHSAKRTHS